MRAAHGSSITPHHGVVGGGIGLQIVAAGDGLQAEPVADREGFGRDEYIIDFRFDAAGVAANPQQDGVLPRRDIRPGHQAQVQGRQPLLRDQRVGDGFQAVIDGKRGQPGSIGRFLGRRRLQHHCAALILAVAGVVLHRDGAHAVPLCREQWRFAGKGKRFVGFQQQLNAGAAVARQHHTQLVRQV